MANAIMMFPPPGQRWTADPSEFASAARNRWSDADVGEPYEVDGRTEVWIQTTDPQGPGLDCTFTLAASGDGYFSVRSGDRPEAAGMFAWVREWLGPGNACAVVETGTADVIADVPFGADVEQVRQLIQSVAPH